MNSSSVSRKKYDEGNSTLTPCQQLRNQNTSVGVGLIEFTGPSDILNFKLKYSSSLSRKRYNGGSSTPTPCQQLQVQNAPVGVELIELIEPSDTLNYKPFFTLFYTLILQLPAKL